MSLAAIDRVSIADLAAATNPLADEIEWRAADCFAVGDALDDYLHAVVNDARLDVIRAGITDPADLATLSHGPDWGSCYREPSPVEATRTQVARLRALEDPIAEVWADALEALLPALGHIERNGQQAPSLAEDVSRYQAWQETGL